MTFDLIKVSKACVPSYNKIVRLYLLLYLITLPCGYKHRTFVLR